MGIDCPEILREVIGGLYRVIFNEKFVKITYYCYKSLVKQVRELRCVFWRGRETEDNGDGDTGVRR
jgi:hypothetical protein